MKNNGLMNLYCFVSSVLGALVLVWAVASYGVALHRLLVEGGSLQIVWTMLNLRHLLFLGLLLLGVPQLYRFVSGRSKTPGWLLRRGEYILYVFILLVIGQAIWQFGTGRVASCLGGVCSVSELTARPMVETILSGAMIFVKVLIMYGMAQSLRVMGCSGGVRDEVG